jgi:hypothetical protein
MLGVVYLLAARKHWREAPGQGRIPYSASHRKHGNHAKGYALRQEMAVLLTFAAGQKFVGRRAETRRFCFWFERKTKRNRSISVALIFP